MTAVKLALIYSFLITSRIWTQAAIGQEATAEPLTNLAIIQSLAFQVADTLAAAVRPGDSEHVSLEVYPPDTRWFLEENIRQAFRRRGWNVVVSDSTRYLASVGALSIRVSYLNQRRSGLFGPRMVDRTIRLTARTTIVDRRSGVILQSGERVLDHADIVEVSLIEALETPGVPSTRGVVPAEGFFSGWAEPLIILGAVAVAVYLLFTVRS